LHIEGLKGDHYSFIGNLVIFLNGILIQIGNGRRSPLDSINIKFQTVGGSIIHPGEGAFH
jgi:energy-converting hydrogenase Eha subunit E